MRSPATMMPLAPRPPVIKEIKWLALAGVLYVGLCVLMLFLSQPQSDIEPVGISRGQRLLMNGGRVPKSLRPIKEEHLSHMTSLLRSHMFTEQGIKLKWIKERIARMSSSWEKAQAVVAMEKGFLLTNPKKILLFPGLLSEYSAYDFANNAFKGGYLGELVQWSDLISTLHMLGHHVSIMTSRQQLSERVPHNELVYDIVFTDYIGLFGLRDSQHFPMYKCRIRVLDSFGTEPLYNFRTRDFEVDSNLGMFNNWGFESILQFWTLFPHTPDNSFLGFVVEPPSLTNVSSKRNQAVLYGKEGWYSQGKENYIDTIGETMQVHSTFKDIDQSLSAHVTNHGVLPASELQRLLSESKLFVGLGFPYDGPGPFEALASGCAFIQPKFNPPHSKDNTPFFGGKPTSRQLSSQVPYLEQFVGEPYVYTVDIANQTAVREVVYKVLSRKSLEPLIPHEFTQRGMLERVGTYLSHQNFCDGVNLALGKVASASSAHEDHTAGEAIDGMLTEKTCFWSAPDVNHWWVVDLGADFNIVKIRITNTFEWVLAKSWGTVFLDPFSVTLLDSGGTQVASHRFTDSRTFYLWEDVYVRARYVRLDSLDYESARYFVVCGVEVYGGSSAHPVWPDLTHMNMVHSKKGRSCKEACLGAGMVCEPAHFRALNKASVLKEAFNCSHHKTISTQYIDFPPAISITEDSKLGVAMATCVTNENTMLLSCAGHHDSYQRLCPCRTYRPGQVALPP